MKFIHLLKRTWPVLLIVPLTWGVIASVGALSKDRPVPADQLARAWQGVAENKDWQPLVRRVDGYDMALVPAGCFQMGSSDAQLEEALASCSDYYGIYGCQVNFDNEQPAHQVCITRPFWIDLTAVTNRQYGKSSVTGKVSSIRPEANWPRESVNWQAAADFCAQRGARLPSEAEWEFAARGPDALIYPFGNEFELSKATLRKISPAPVGEIPEGASWVGALDMSGGIGEWVQDWYGPYPAVDQVDPGGPAQGDKRIARGGNWSAHAAFLVRTTFREALDPAYATSVVGFRCVLDLDSTD
jgi:formylglycine-generating enzyme required for sulfatase activity